MGEGDATPQNLGGEEEVSRCLFGNVDLDLASALFQTSSDGKYYEPDSVMWRRYLPAVEDVHGEGCRLQLHKLGRGSKVHLYVGCQTASVADILKISIAGHTLRVYQIVEHGNEFHCHVEIRNVDGTTKKVSKPERTFLAHKLVQCYSAIDQHKCPV